MMENRGYIECPGCGRTMGRLPAEYINELNRYEVRLFCPCGWMSPIGWGATREEAIDKAFMKAKIRVVEK